MLFIKQILVALMLIGISMSCISCSKRDEPVFSDNIVRVEIIKAVLQDYNEDLTSFGTISYKTKNDLTALVGGTLIDLRVREGDTVYRGQLLARLRNVQLELQRDQALNTVESANVALKNVQAKKWENELGIESRFLSLVKTDINILQKELELENAFETLKIREDLFNINGITESALKESRLSVQSLEAQIDMMKKEREISTLGLRDEDLLNSGIIPSLDFNEKFKQLIELNTRTIATEIVAAEVNIRNTYKSLNSIETLINELNLYAPMSGIIGARYYESGEFIKENEKVFTIIDTVMVSAIFFIQEHDIIYFAKGSPLTLSIQSLNKKIDAQITEISPMADPGSGNFTVKSDIGNNDGQIKPGMFVQCSIPRFAAQKLIALPETVLLKKSGNKGSVFVVVNERLVLKDVEIKNQRDGSVWLSEGITQNEYIVNKPSPFLKEGQYVSTN